MRTEDFLKEVAALPGCSGNERVVAEYIKNQFEPFVDEVYIDGLNCVYAHKKGTGPKVLVCAHLDEIGAMVEKIEEDGSVRFAFVGGVDPRVMPGMRVTVYGKETLLGVVGAKAPHLLTAEERTKNYQREDMFVDMGMSKEELEKVIKVGDNICFDARFVGLLNNRYVTKTADDRACVAIMLKTAEMLQKMTHNADITFVATCQEEVGCHGAKVSSYHLAPDFGIAFDVTHAVTPGADRSRTSDLESLVADRGPHINQYMRKKLDEVANNNNVVLQDAVSPSYTSTDEDYISIQRSGVPSILFSLPLKYMHTNVELFSMGAMKEGARLLALYLCEIDSSWEDELWN